MAFHLHRHQVPLRRAGKIKLIAYLKGASAPFFMPNRHHKVQNDIEATSSYRMPVKEVSDFAPYSLSAEILTSLILFYTYNQSGYKIRSRMGPLLMEVIRKIIHYFNTLYSFYLLFNTYYYFFLDNNIFHT